MPKSPRPTLGPVRIRPTGVLTGQAREDLDRSPPVSTVGKKALYFPLLFHCIILPKRARTSTAPF